MLGLRDLQAAFKCYLMSGEGGVADQIVGTAEMAVDRRLAVYANAYRARLTEALATDYEALRSVLGADAFMDLSHGYADAYPSTHYSLRWFGRHLPNHLRQQYDQAPYLAELAEFEWSLAAAFDAADAPLAGVEAAAAIPAASWPALRLRLHPSVRWLCLTWNVLDLWRSAKEAGQIFPPKRLAEPVACLAWRDGLTTRYRSMEPMEQGVLAAAAGGASFAELCEQLRDGRREDGHVALQAAGFLKTWLSTGLVAELIP